MPIVNPEKTGLPSQAEFEKTRAALVSAASSFEAIEDLCKRAITTVANCPALRGPAMYAQDALSGHLASAMALSHTLKDDLTEARELAEKALNESMENKENA